MLVTGIIDRFHVAGNGVLIGSQSFWEGVDVRGDALAVVIDKTTVCPPDDPVLAAREFKRMEKKGLNGFVHHQLPEAITPRSKARGD